MKPATAPTERSMPPVMMANVSPIGQDRDHRALAQQVGHIVRGPEGRGLDREREPHDEQQAEQGEAEQHVQPPAASTVLRDGLVSHVV